jgi:hypothetical protein
MCTDFCSETPYLNKCNDGFILYLDKPVGSFVQVYIKLYGGGTLCKTLQIGVGQIVKVDFKPSDYFHFNKIQINIKDLQGIDIAIPYNASTVCGLELNISDNCETGYLRLNGGIETTCTWDFPYYDCTWTNITYNCTWTLNMITQIRYGTATTTIQNPPMVNSILAVNPLFEDELDAIEAGAFVASIVGTNVVVTYIGMQDVEFIDENGDEVAKSCV